MSVAFVLTPHERRIVLDTARLSIAARLAGKEASLPVPPLGILHEPLGSFVTLHMHGALRGCVGTMVSQEPLYHTAARMALAAAFHDGRFAPLTIAEWPQTSIEISVLGPLTLCPDVGAIELGRHGLLLHLQGKSGVFLPKVPIEQGWDKNTYLEQLCHKAGLPKGSWKHPQAQVYWYEALVFGDES